MPGSEDHRQVPPTRRPAFPSLGSLLSTTSIRRTPVLVPQHDVGDVDAQRRDQVQPFDAALPASCRTCDGGIVTAALPPVPVGPSDVVAELRAALGADRVVTDPD